MQTEQQYEVILGDQKTEDWHYTREGLVTGSRAKDVKSSGMAWHYEMLAVMTTPRKPKDLSKIKDVKRGLELEPKALEEYKKYTGNKNLRDDIAFVKRGRYGASPDAVEYDESIGLISLVVEFKAADTNNHIRYILTNEVPKEHKDQIINYFVTMPNLQEVHFVSYDPKYKLKPLHIIKVYRKDYAVEIATTEIKYEKFIEGLDADYKKLLEIV